MPSDITPAVPRGHQIINGYGGGGFTIGGERYESSVLVLPESTNVWPVNSIEEVTVESLLSLQTADPAVEILIFGGGDSMPFVTAEFRSALKEIGVVVEPMDTGAACRTFNVLLAVEGGSTAALIAVG
ncbi:MAG: Mth938-like domain-containing protein [Proteobacteria bacterium]|nr:Mth938-like domain-containing protein [Pseudomonadota bacterium]